MFNSRPKSVRPTISLFPRYPDSFAFFNVLSRPVVISFDCGKGEARAWRVCCETVHSHNQNKLDAFKCMYECIVLHGEYISVRPPEHIIICSVTTGISHIYNFSIGCFTADCLCRSVTAVL